MKKNNTRQEGGEFHANYPSVSTTLCVDDAHGAIALYRNLFKAEVELLIKKKDGKIRHAQLRVGDSLILLSDEFPEIGIHGPHFFHGSPITMLVYVSDVDAVFDRAINAGCKAVRAVSNQFHGDRTGKFEDPFGHHWSIATPFENISPREIERRAELMEHQ